jgi:phage gpG-like protein
MIEVEVRGLDRLERFLANLANFSSRRSALLKELGDLVRKHHLKRVLSEKTSPSGAAWAADLPATVAKKGNGNILVESGRMAWAWQLHYGASMFTMKNTATSPRGGAKYLGFHQFGTRKMVMREVMGYSQANLKEIADVVNAFVASRMGLAA